VFHVYDRHDLASIPRRYTVEAGKSLDDRWAFDAAQGYDRWVIGPNGFLRSFAGTAAGRLATLRYDRAADGVRIVRRGTVTLALRDGQYGQAGPVSLDRPRAWPLGKSHGWYDLIVEGDGVRQRFAGRMETGRHGVSDPALA